MGFTNQIFKWIGDVAQDLGESKANQMFIGVAGGAKSPAKDIAGAAAVKEKGTGGPPPPPSGDGENGSQNPGAETPDSNKKI